MSSGISNFNTQTGLSFNNPEYPRIGNYSCNTCTSSSSGGCCVPVNGIIMYNDTDALFPNYTLEGATWNICDGNFGTIDLRNSFVLGNDSNANLGTTGGSTTTTCTITLTAADLPQHNHPFTITVFNPGAGGGTTAGIAFAGTTIGNPSSCNHFHTNFGGTWGFNYWVPTATGISLPGAAAGPEVNANPCPSPGCYFGPSGVLGNTTGGVASTPTDLNTHQHGVGGIITNWANILPANGGNCGGITDNAGTPAPIVITSSNITIIPPYVKLYYIQRTS